jgi:hypothetical protein
MAECNGLWRLTMEGTGYLYPTAVPGGVSR